MRKFAVLVLFGLLAACSSGGGSNAQRSASPGASPMASPQNTAGAQSVVLHPTNMSFKAAGAACAGSLGSITFAMGHARAHAATGVTLSEPETPTAVTHMTFSDKAHGKTAAVLVNAHDRSVSGKNVTAKANRSVACIGPE